MSQEILINVTPRETRVATVENGVLQEIAIERSKRLGLVGNIYKGKVLRVLPGMQAAFVDIGLERAAFLHASDIQGFKHIPLERDVLDEPAALPGINELVREGQELLVQVIKDPIGTKGARLGTQITIPSRYLVFLPNVQVRAVSARIEDEEERQRLLQIVSSAPEKWALSGYIVRTAAESAPASLIAQDVGFLHRLWESISLKAKTARSGDLVYVDLPLALRTLRDLNGHEIERIRIDSETVFADLPKPFCQIFPSVSKNTAVIALFLIFTVWRMKLKRPLIGGPPLNQEAI
jgi:ribonuclease G